MNVCIIDYIPEFLLQGLIGGRNVTPMSMQKK
jgi:hypothetical protein